VQNPPTITTNTVPYLWDTKDPDLDDALHNPDPIRDARLDRSFTLFSARGWANVFALLVLALGLLTLFGAYPIINAVTRNPSDRDGFNSVNGTGQINKLPNFPSLVDDDTPTDALTRVGSDGTTYHLAFSDEFNRDGRTFYPGDDPYWEAVDLHYWPTDNVEWYDPGQITTEGGKLVITMERRTTHNLDYVSGMLQGWNKLCFTTGYVEVSVSLPGSSTVQGFWPGIWSMGNLVSNFHHLSSLPLVNFVSSGTGWVWCYDRGHVAIQLRHLRSWNIPQSNSSGWNSARSPCRWKRGWSTELPSWPESQFMHCKRLLLGPCWCI